MYLYENHMGGIYTSEFDLDFDDLFCDSCGDADRLLGKFDNIRDVIAYLAEDINIYESGGYSLDYLIKNLSEIGTIALNEAEQIVLANSTCVKCTDCRWFKGHDGNKPICKYQEDCMYDEQPFDFGVPDRCRLMYEAKEKGDKTELD